MIIIFGTRPTFRTEKVNQYDFCTQCNQFGKLRSYNATKCFHLYYIPLIPVESRQRSHQVCSRCNQGLMFPREHYQDLIASLMARMADAVVALQNNEATFEIEGQEQPEDAVGYLHQTINWLYGANQVAFCQGLVQQLDRPNTRFAHALLRASLEMTTGKHVEAITSYAESHRLSPTSKLPLYMITRLLAVKRRHEEAIPYYNTLIGLASAVDERLPLLVQLAENLTNAKQFAEASATYDKIFELAPSLRDDKSFSKLANKAKKKAGL